MDRALARIEQRRVAWARTVMAAWRTVRQERVEKEERERRLKRLSARTFNHKTHRIFDTWKEYAQDLKSTRYEGQTESSTSVVKLLSPCKLCSL